MPSLRSDAAQGRRPGPSRNNDARKTDKRNFNKAQREILEEFFQRKKFTFSQKDLKQLFEQCKEVDQHRQFVTIEKIKLWFKEKRKEEKQSKQNAPAEEEREEDAEEEEAMEEDPVGAAPAEDPVADPVADLEATPAPEAGSAAETVPPSAPDVNSEVASTADPQEGTSSQGFPRENSTETFTGSTTTVTSEKLDFNPAQRRCLQNFFKTKQSDLTREELEQLMQKCLSIDQQRKYATVERIEAWFAEKRRTVRSSVSIPRLPPPKPLVIERRVEEPAEEGLLGVIKEDPMAARLANPVAPPDAPGVNPEIPETSDGLRDVMKEDPMAANLTVRGAMARPETPRAQDPEDSNPVAPEDATMPQEAPEALLDPEALLEQELLREPEEGQGSGAPLDPGALLDAEALLNLDPEALLNPEAAQDPKAPQGVMEEDPAAPEDAMEEGSVGNPEIPEDLVVDPVDQVTEDAQDFRDDEVEAPEEEIPEEEAPETIGSSIEEDLDLEQEDQNPEDLRDQDHLQDAVNEDLDAPIQDAEDQNPAAQFQDAMDEDLETDSDASMDEAPVDMDQGSQDDPGVDLNATIREIPEDHEDPAVPNQDLMDMDQGFQEDREVDLNATFRVVPEDQDDREAFMDEGSQEYPELDLNVAIPVDPIDNRETPATSLTPVSPITFSFLTETRPVIKVKVLKDSHHWKPQPQPITVDDGEKVYEYIDSPCRPRIQSPSEADYEIVEAYWNKEKGGYSFDRPSPTPTPKNLPPAPKKTPVDVRNAKSQADIYVPKPLAYYKKEEEAVVDYELKKRVESIDFDEAIRKRVGLYGEAFRNVHLPCSGSLDYGNWSEEETFEFLCQCLPLNVLAAIQQFKLDGEKLGDFWNHSIFKFMNNSSKLISYEDFSRLGNKMWQMLDAVDERQSVLYQEEYLINRRELEPKLHFPFKALSGDYIDLEKDDEQTQTDEELYIETHVDKLDPEDNRVTVGLQTRHVKELRRENVRKYGRDYQNVYLPFNGETNMKNWTRVDVAEFCCQFLPLPAVRAIWDYRISGFFLPFLADESNFFCALNMTKVVITHIDFLKMMREIKRVRVLYHDRVKSGL